MASLKSFRDLFRNHASSPAIMTIWKHLSVSFDYMAVAPYISIIEYLRKFRNSDGVSEAIFETDSNTGSYNLAVLIDYSAIIFSKILSTKLIGDPAGRQISLPAGRTRTAN